MRGSEVIVLIFILALVIFTFGGIPLLSLVVIIGMLLADLKFDFISTLADHLESNYKR